MSVQRAGELLSEIAAYEEAITEKKRELQRELKGVKAGLHPYSKTHVMRVDVHYGLVGSYSTAELEPLL